MNTKLKYLKSLKLMNCVLDGICVLQEVRDIKKTKRKRSCSVRKINRDREMNGFFVQSFLIIKEMDHQQFFIYTRMTPRAYEHLLEFVKPFLEKNSLRQPVQPECRLAVTMMYLTQGDSFQSLAQLFKLGKETVRQIVLETSEVLWSVLSNVYVNEPNENGYKQIAEDFWQLWNMPNCIGALDGKHIAIQCPPHGGNQQLSRKNCSSIVLLAACDARYQFTHIETGASGSQSEGGIFQRSRFAKRLLNKTLPIPSPQNLPNTDLKIPHFFVGGAAFPLGTNLMRPYPGEVLPIEKDAFNERLSRVCRTIENAFGILLSRWRVLLTTLHFFPENAEKIVLACVALHNFIMLNEASSYIPTNYVDWEDANGDLHEGTWRCDIKNTIQSIRPSANSHQYGGRNSTEIRKYLCEFFLSS